jgi:predicted  nucleic acid-binding Zn-ribbon protein
MSDLQQQVADANELNALTIEELESHQKAGAGLRAELEAARAELEAARTGLDEARTANVALSTSLEAALGDGTARQREVDELTGRLAAATANVESLLADASRTEEQLATSEGHLRRSRDEVDVLVARVAELESRVGDSDASLAAAESLATEASNVAMGLRRELAAAAERESGLEARLAEATEHASGLEARLAEATEHASGLEARLAEATGQVSGLEARLAEATGQVSGLEAELAHARQESTTLAEALATASRDLAEFREGAVEYQLRIEELTAAVARVEADKAAAGDEIVSYQAMLTQVRDERDALLAELESSREQRRKVEHELTDSAAALAAEREQVAGLTRRLSVASTNEQRLSSELLFAQDALEEVRMEHQAERAMHAAALAERESFAAGLQARLARESAAADALVGALKADIEALTRQVSDLTGTLIHREALRTGFADALAGLLSRFAAEPTLELQPPVAPGFVAAEAALAALRGESPAPAPEPVPVPEPPAPAEKPSRKRRSSSAVSAPEAVAAVAAPVVVAEVVADMVAPLAAESSAVAVDGNASSLSVEDADIEVTEEIEPESVVFDDDAFDFDSADLVIVSDEDGDGA